MITQLWPLNFILRKCYSTSRPPTSTTKQLRRQDCPDSANDSNVRGSSQTILQIVGKPFSSLGNQTVVCYLIRTALDTMKILEPPQSTTPIMVCRLLHADSPQVFDAWSWRDLANLSSVHVPISSLRHLSIFFFPKTSQKCCCLCKKHPQ